MKKSYFLYPNFRKDLEFCILVESYVDSRSQNVCSFFSFCKSSRQVIGAVCPILLYERVDAAAAVSELLYLDPKSVEGGAELTSGALLEK